MGKKLSIKEINVSKHRITKDKMDSDAIEILQKLINKGYKAYLVGGCIRDYISGTVPKDYDIVTDARPKTLLKIFPKSLLVGRRFPLVHVRVPGKRNKVIEVATFRTKYAEYKTKNIFCRWLLKFFVFGNLEQDALRRDISSQALYWRLEDEVLLDFHGGFDDIKHKRIAIIGDAATRFNEDPVRILRILRVMAKLHHTIDDNIHNEINKHKNLLTNVSSSRLFGEVIKTFHGGFAVRAFNLMLKYKLENILFANVVSNKNAEKWLRLGLAQADARYASGLSLSSGYLFAVMLWPLFIKHQSKNRYNVTQYIRKIINKQHKKTAIPKRNCMMIETIWRLQLSLLRVENHAQAKKLYKQPGFRAAYDFLLLRAEFSSDFQHIANAWTTYINLPLEKAEKFSFKVQEIEAPESKN